MKFLLTAHQFFPDFAAGTEVLTRSVARELIRRGHEVHVLTGFPATQAMADHHRYDEYDLDGIHVYRFHHAYTPMGGQISSIALGYDNHLAAEYFARILKRFQPDIVHFFHLNRLGTGLIEQAVAKHVPAYFTPTDFWAICPTAQLRLPDGNQCNGPGASAGNCVKHFAHTTAATQGQAGVTLARWLPVVVADRVVRWTMSGHLPDYPYSHEVHAMGARLSCNIKRLNQLNKIVVPNAFMGCMLQQYGVAAEKMVECAFGIDTTVSAKKHAANAVAPIHIGFIGSLASHKGAHVLVEAAKLLPAGSVTVSVYGNVDEVPEYVADLRLRAMGYPSIALRGVFPNEQIGDVFQDLDVLVVPSLWFENTPLVVYSAQAARCPVVASDFPGISAVIEHEHNGLLFEAGNVAALAAQLMRLVSEEGLAAKLSAAAKPPKSTGQYVDELLALWNAT